MNKILEIKAIHQQEQSLIELKRNLRPGKPYMDITVSKISDEVSFKLRGPDADKNLKRLKSKVIDPTVIKCICKCYCGSVRNQRENQARYVDRVDIQDAYSEDL